MPLAVWIAAKYFVPFYRRNGQISAYQHLEDRFGLWARTYAMLCYLLTQIARMGTIMLAGCDLASSADDDDTAIAATSDMRTMGLIVVLVSII